MYTFEIFLVFIFSSNDATPFKKGSIAIKIQFGLLTDNLIIFSPLKKIRTNEVTPRSHG